LNNPAKTLEIKREITKLKRSFMPDLIHRNSVGVGDLFNLMTPGIHPAPLLVTLHGKWLPQADMVVSQTLQAASWVIGCSQTILNVGAQLVPNISERSSIIYNAVEKPDLATSPLPWDPPVLLCLGRMARVKGFDLVLTALATLIRDFPTVRLIMAGDGPERHALEQQAHDLGLRNSVDFHGWVHPKSVPELINTATIVLMPSRFESLPLTALQAAQMNRPVIATCVGGLPEVITHNQTGLLVEPENSQALTSAVSDLLGNPAHAVHLGQAAGIRASTYFSWERHIDSYAVLYRKLVTRWRESRTELKTLQSTP
jgi:glycogen(starch) synthase